MRRWKDILDLFRRDSNFICQPPVSCLVLNHNRNIGHRDTHIEILCETLCSHVSIVVQNLKLCATAAINSSRWRNKYSENVIAPNFRVVVGL
jgi:hypothetical protein